MRRVALVASHPVQYQAPWYRVLPQSCDLTVFYAHRQDAIGQASAGFSQPFEWDVPLLDGYRYRWLQNVSSHPGVDDFRGCDTPGIRAELAAGRFDACIVNGWYLKAYVQAIQAGRALGIPVLVRSDSQLAGPRSLITRTLKYWPYRWGLRRIDAHLSVGRANRRYLRHYGVQDDRIFQVPHAVDTGRFAADAARARTSGERERMRTAWGALPRTTVFLFVGKLIDRKRPADLLEAVGRATADGLDARAVIVGSGPAEAALRKMAEAAEIPAVFAGFRNQQHLGAWYAASDCLVLPSDGRETWGLVVNEAMACGIPAIVSDEVGCAEDLIDAKRTGLTYPCGDVDALARAMEQMAGALAGQSEEIQAALRARSASCSYETATRNAIEAIESALGRGRVRREPAGEAQHA